MAFRQQYIQICSAHWNESPRLAPYPAMLRTDIIVCTVEICIELPAVARQLPWEEICPTLPDLHQEASCGAVCLEAFELLEHKYLGYY